MDQYLMALTDKLRVAQLVKTLLYFLWDQVAK